MSEGGRWPLCFNCNFVCTSMEKSFLYISNVSCSFWYDWIWNSLRCSSRYFQAEAFLFCSVLGLVLAFVLVGVHSSLSLGLPCPLQNFIGAAIGLLLVFLARIFVLVSCESGFGCRDSCYCFSLFVARSHGLVCFYSNQPIFCCSLICCPTV
jgi:hypothetical protein